MSEPTVASYDVVVVGAGNAALTAALAAREADARVVILEKATQDLRGGNTRFSGALFRFAYQSLQDIRRLIPELSDAEAETLDVGTYTEEKYYEDVMRVTHGEADADLTRVMVHQSLPVVEWMTQYGVLWELTSLFNVTVGNRRIFNPGSVLQARGKGVGLSEMLFRAVEARDIPILYQTKFLRLLLDQHGSVRGAEVRGPQGTEEIGCGAIVLACGGFEANAEMRARYLGGDWDRAKVRGTKYNTGEGLVVALEAGAKPAGHWRGCHATPIDAGAPAVGDLKLTDLTNRLSYLYSVMVNVHGKRFIDEGEDLGQYTYAKTGGAILSQPGSLAYQIFDQKTVGLLEKRYETGTPIVANTIEELANGLDLEPLVLTQTVQGFNEAVQDGEFNPAVLDGKGARGPSPVGSPSRSAAWRLTCRDGSLIRRTPPFRGYTPPGRSPGSSSITTILAVRVSCGAPSSASWRVPRPPSTPAGVRVDRFKGLYKDGPTGGI
jgi:tricarballylate dehydrogenase